MQKEVNAHLRQNVVVTPLNYAQQLCDLALAMNSTMDVAPRKKPEDVWEFQSDAKGFQGWKLESGYEAFARRSDACALEAASCVVASDPGDLLLLFPGVFHRTQDVGGHRVAIIAEATRSFDS